MPHKTKTSKKLKSSSKKAGAGALFDIKSRKFIIALTVLIAGIGTFFTIKSFALDPDGPIYRRMATCTPSSCMNAAVLGRNAFRGPTNSKGTISYRLSNGGKTYTSHPVGGIKFTRNQSFTACTTIQPVVASKPGNAEMILVYEGGLRVTHPVWSTNKRSWCIVDSHQQRPYDRAVHSVEVVNKGANNIEVFETYIDHIDIRTWDHPPVK